MNTKISGFALAALATIFTAGPAFAAGDDIKQLAAHTGLSESKVRMILGCRTCNASYTYTYQRSLEQFREALGQKKYEQLMSGQPILLDDGIEVREHVAAVNTR